MEHEPTLIFQQRLARLQSLLEASRRVHATIELQEVLRETLKTLVKELELPGALFLPGEKAPDLPRLAYGRAAQILLETPDAWTGLPCIPLKAKDGGEAARLAIIPPNGRSLEMDEEDFLEGLALQASVAIENARYHEKSLKWARVSRDLETARAIQRSLLPQTMPAIDGYRVAAKSEACYEVGGDYLDIFPTPSGGFLFVVADVAGKGLSSALIGSSFRTGLRAMASTDVPLADLASTLGELHYADGEEARLKYVTAILARLDPRSHLLEVVNAGHPPGFVVDRSGSETLIKSSGPPLGMLPGIAYKGQSLEIAPGSALLMYSDGLSEAARGDDEFGREGILSVLKETCSESPERILDALWAAVLEYEEGREPGDDKTVFVLKRESQ